MLVYILRNVVKKLFARQMPNDAQDSGHSSTKLFIRQGETHFDKCA